MHLTDDQELALTSAVNNLNIDGLYHLARLLHAAKKTGSEATSEHVKDLVASAVRVAGDVNRSYRKED